MPKNTKSFPMYDFSGGMNSKTPKEMLLLKFAPYCKNVLWDEKNRISKVFGTTALLTAANNAFATNPIYNLYNYIETDGSEVLIIQGIASATMKLWRLRTADTLGAVTDITPTGVTLALQRKINFATHKGLLYATNGTNDLLVGDANSTATWRKLHTEKFEKFRYITTHNHRIWMGRSVENPIRIIWSGVNEGHFGAYYGDEGINPATGYSYLGDANWMDFPTPDGTPITGMCPFQGTLLVFKPNHIIRVFGDPLYGGVTVQTVVYGDGKGCVADGSIANKDDRLIFRMAKDGIRAYGDTGLAVSAEDQKVQTTPNDILVTADIQNYWDTNMTVPNPLNRRCLVKSGSSDYSGFTLSSCTVRTSTTMTWRPPVITFNLAASAAEEIKYEPPSHDVPVALTSVGTSGSYDESIYYAQTVTATKLGITYGIPEAVDLYLENYGTLTSSQKLNVYVTGTKENEEGVDVPDLSVVYAVGQMSDCSTITTSAWHTVTMSYWDYPQGLLAGAASPTLAVVVKPVGDTAALYVKWLSDNDGYGGGRMVNSDMTNPANQATYDYGFRISCKNFVNEALITTDAFNASADSSFVHWDEVNIEMDNKAANGYARRSKLTKVEWDLSANGSDWDGYVTANSLRDVAGTKKYIRFRLTFRRPTTNYADKNDSFSLITIKATYVTQAVTASLVKGIMWDDRYIVCGGLADSGG